MIGRTMYNAFKPKQNSKGLAMVFMTIAIVGMVLMATNSYQGSSLKNNNSASTDSTLASSINQQRSSYSIYAIRTVIITVCIVVILFVIANIYRRQKRSDLPNTFDLKVLGRKYVSAKHYLLLLKFKKRLLLVGVTDSSFELLCEIDDQDESDDEVMLRTDSFSDLVRKYSRRRKTSLENPDKE